MATRFILRTGVLSALLLFLAACGEQTADLTPPPEVQVSINPTEASLEPGETQEFTATVTGTNNTAVTWSATGGTIEGEGATVTYTAPEQEGEFTVTATSVAEPTASASATVTVTAPPPEVQVSIDPTEVTLEPGQTQEFTATVTGADDTSVIWSTTGGIIEGEGATVTYTAPAQEGNFTVTAMSVADPTASASATVTVTAAPPPPGVQVSIEPAEATLEPGGTQQFTATVTGTDDPSVTWSTDGGTIEGEGATVTYTAPEEEGNFTVTATSVADPTASASATVTVTAAPPPPPPPPGPGLVLDMTFTSDPVHPGERIAFSLTVSNQGAMPLNNVQLLYLFPAEFDGLNVRTYADDGRCNGSWTCNPGRDVSWNLGTLAAGQSETFFVRPVVRSDILDGTTIENRARVEFEGGSTVVEVRNLLVRSAPTLTLAIAADERTVLAGESITYTLAFSNIGNASSPNTILSAPVPEGTTFVSASGGGVLNGNTVEWELGTVAVSESGRRQFEVVVESGQGGPVTAQASIRDSLDNTAQADTLSKIRPSRPLSLEIEYASDPVQPGERILFTLTVRNQGPTPLANVQLLYLFPAEFDGLNVRTYADDGRCNGSWTCNPGQDVSWNLGMLDIGQEVVLHVRPVVHFGLLNGTLIYNLARASYDGGHTSMEYIAIADRTP